MAKLQAEQEAMCENSRVAAKSDSEEETVAVVQMVEDDAGKEMLSQAQQEDEGISKLLKRCADVGTRSSWHVSILRAGVIESCRRNSSIMFSSAVMITSEAPTFTIFL